MEDLCKNCPYKGKNKLLTDISTVKWRKGLVIAIAIVGLLSIAIDIITLTRLIGL